MAVERESTAASLIDVLDRVLDKGIVIDAWVRVSARVVVASIATYLEHARELGPTGLVSRPIASGAAPPRAGTTSAGQHSAETAPTRHKLRL